MTYFIENVYSEPLVYYTHDGVEKVIGFHDKTKAERFCASLELGDRGYVVSMEEATWYDNENPIIYCDGLEYENDTIINPETGEVMYE